MSFDFNTLITDRTNADVSSLSSLMKKPLSAWTADELEKFNNGLLKGGYWWTDLNRVTSCMEYIVSELQKYGYNTPGYSKVYIDRSPASRLPDGYTELEYIESSGTQYIDTGVKPNQNTRVVCDAVITGPSTAALFGARNSVGESSFIFWKLSSDSLRVDYASTNKTTTFDLSNRFVVDFNQNVCTFGGQTIDFTSSTFTCNFNILFLTQNTGGEVDTRLITGKIYSASIYYNEEQVREFVPCTNQSGEVGLYDLINGEFYANVGTGVFTAGPEVQNSVNMSLDPYTWYEDDAPTKPQMEQYRSNVASIRAVLEVLDTTPETPDSMEKLTYQKANDLEKILVDVETVIEYIVKGMARSNCFTFWSGSRPIPCASSNLGRTREELDAMNVPWENLENVDWYLLAYGNLGVS